MCYAKTGGGVLMDGMQLSNQDTIKSLEEKETYKSLEMLETDNIKQTEMKENV